MDGMQGTSPALAQGVIKDATGAQLISKTLDKISAVQSTAPEIDAVQIQKNAMQAAGLGTRLDMIA